MISSLKDTDFSLFYLTVDQLITDKSLLSMTTPDKLHRKSTMGLLGGRIFAL
ncbi:MAG: hypothetical protein J6B31_01345 [Bacteroidaceae bacterium]|nr:hypothetical protein [Bacteroidaceae bacterium]